MCEHTRARAIYNYATNPHKHKRSYGTAVRLCLTLNDKVTRCPVGHLRGGFLQSILLSVERNLLKQSSSYFLVLLFSALLPIPPRLPSGHYQLVVQPVCVCVCVHICEYVYARLYSRLISTVKHCGVLQAFSGILMCCILGSRLNQRRVL